MLVLNHLCKVALPFVNPGFKPDRCQCFEQFGEYKKAT